MSFVYLVVSSLLSALAALTPRAVQLCVLRDLVFLPNEPISQSLQVLLSQRLPQLRAACSFKTNPFQVSAFCFHSFCFQMNTEKHTRSHVCCVWGGAPRLHASRITHQKFLFSDFQISAFPVKSSLIKANPAEILPIRPIIPTIPIKPNQTRRLANRKCPLPECGCLHLRRCLNCTPWLNPSSKSAN